MKVLLDLNVLLDVLDRREPHYDSSAKLLSLVADKRIQGVLPGHAPATIHYLIARSSGTAKANEAVDWLLNSLHLASATHDVYVTALALGFPDFEDAVVATMAAMESCGYIATRNQQDFVQSPVVALTPRQILDLLNVH